MNEVYLLDAISFTEAERRINEEAEQFVSGGFEVTNIKVSNLVEIHPVEDCQYWFKAKVCFITIDEEKGKERKSNANMLVQADNAREAYDNLEAALSDMTVDYTIPAIAESPILDVFPFFGKEESAETVQQAPEGFVPVQDEAPMEEIPQEEEIESEAGRNRRIRKFTTSNKKTE